MKRAMAVMLSLCIVLTLAFAPMSAYAGGSGAAPAESESVAVPAAVGEEEAADSGSDGEVGSGGQQDQEALGDPADEAGISELAIDEPAGPEEAEADADAEAEAAAEAVADAEPVEIIVVMKDRADEEAVVEDVSGGDDTVVDTVSLGDGEKMVVVEAVADPEEAIAAYEEDPNVAFAQPNYSYGLMDEEPVEPLGSVEALAAATDTKYGFQWALQEGAMPGVAEAWDLMPAEAGKVRVAVLDTGVQYNHPDLDDNINTSLAYDAHLGLPGVSNITDPTGHGTHVTGIIAAETNKNDTANSVAGVSANHAEIVPIRVFFNTAEGYVSSTRDLVAGLEYAMANGCKIVNISAGGPEEDLALKGKLDEAKAAGVLVICAAGNAKNEDPVYPSDFDSVISVTATNKDNKWADNFGSSKSPGSSYNAYKDIAAPGGSADNLTLGQDDSRILSTFPTSGLGYASGTSMASPFVAGVAAMVWAASPGLSRDEVENLLLSTATDITDAPATPGRDDYTGKGLVNAAAAVGQAVLMHTVTFKNYNGTVLKMEVVDDGMNATAPAEPVRTGYEFAGWDTEFTNVTENLTVTATFSAKTYTVTFNAGSGSKATPATKTVTYDQPIGTLATASARTGSTFLGWYTAASGGTQVTAATVYRVAGNTTYYAHWSGSTNKWVTDGGKWYYFGPNGTPLTGWQTVDGQVRYFDPAQGGACPQGWFVHSNGKKYYFWWGGKGTFATGLTEIGGRTYYLNAQGYLVSGWQTVNGQTRYFDPAQGGAAPQGWFVHSNGKKYYFWWSGAGVFATGLTEIGGRAYYFNAQGHLVSGWQNVNGQTRYFDPAQGGAAPQGWFVHSNGKKYYFWWGGAGIFATGLADIGGRTYYFNSQGHLVSGWQTVDGQTRYFDPAQGGAAPQGWFTHSNGKRYYFWWGGKGVFATGVAQIGSKCYYFNPQGHLTSGWQTYAGQVRYFDPAQGGAAPEGWFKHSNGETYYFWPGGGGTFATGLAAIGGGGDEYYFNAQGHLVRNASGIIYGIWVIKTDANGKATKWVSEVLRGIDVSEWQGKIDWGAVKASGVDFAIIRAGWTDWKNRTGEGMGAYFHPDSRFVQNVREARAAGLAVGTYIYVYSRNIQEQEWGLANFEAYVRSNGLIFDLPVFLDIEDDKYYLPSTNNLGGYGYRTTMLQHGLAQLRGYGYQPGFYTFLNWANTQFDAKGLYDDGNSFWLARWYNNDSELDKYTTSWNGTYPSLWQYRSTGKVSGISGNVDMNYMYPLFLKP